MNFAKVQAIIFLLALQSIGSLGQDFCDPTLCPAGVKHIACNNTGAFKAACASNAKIIPMSISLSSLLLDAHNKARNNVAGGNIPQLPIAGRMATMQWSAVLSNMCRFNLRRCVLKKDDCHNTIMYPNAGQNLVLSRMPIGSTTSVETLALRQIDAWYNQYKTVSMRDIKSYTDDNAVHFKQMVRGKSTAVGCAIMRQTLNNKIEQYLCCDYAASNNVTKAVYTSAAVAGLQCKTGKSTIYKNLCNIGETYNL